MIASPGLASAMKPERFASAPDPTSISACRAPNTSAASSAAMTLIAFSPIFYLSPG
jgi:hypothetical protein